MQLVDRFLAQDSTQEALQQLQQEALAYLQHLHHRSSDLQVCSLAYWLFTTECLVGMLHACTTHPAAAEVLA